MVLNDTNVESPANLTQLVRTLHFIWRSRGSNSAHSIYLSYGWNSSHKTTFFCWSSSLVGRNFTIKVDKWDDLTPYIYNAMSCQLS
jgi:hypothetical protein